MKNILAILVGLLVFTQVSTARADRDGKRQFGLFAGGGLARSFANAQQQGVDAKLQGWSNSAEIGLDLPFSGNFGSNVSAELGQDELTNSLKSDSYLENTTLVSKGLKAGLYYKAFGVGGGYRLTKMNIRSFSSTNGSSTAELDGKSMFAYASFSLDYRNLIRTSVEVQGQNFEVSGLRYSDVQVGLRIYFLFSGLVR